jgi:hypothetical protein
VADLRDAYQHPLEDLPLFTDEHGEAMEAFFAGLVGTPLRQLWRVPGPWLSSRCGWHPSRGGMMAALIPSRRRVAVNGCQTSNLKTCDAFKAAGARWRLFVPQETRVRIFAA